MDNIQNLVANKKLIKLNDEMENYFRNTEIPQLFIDANLILRKFTPPAMRQFQLSSDDIGKSIHELKNRIRFPTIVDNILEVIDTNKDIEKDIQTTDLKWFQMNILPYINQKSNESNGVIITFVEISSRIEILNQYEKLNKDYENVIFALSHDLKGPIVNIKSMIGFLKDNEIKNKEEGDNLVESIDVSVQKLLGTIQDLTESIQNKTAFAEVSERVDIESILDDVKIGLKDKITVSEAKIHTDFQIREFNLSRKNLRSILFNLLSNAIKFSGQKGIPHIWVKSYYTTEHIHIVVRDNGPGIKKDKQELIFLPRTRLNQDVEGSGTGLFIVRRMVEEMDGQVEVESSPGEGATFRIYFDRKSRN